LKISQYVLKNNIADYVLTGGVVGHLFMAAKGINLGKSNMDFLKAKELMGFVPGIQELMKAFPKKIDIPSDVAVEEKRKRKEIAVKELPTDCSIYDIGEETVKKYSEIIRKAKSIVISGPMGVFENKDFAKGTRKVFEAIAASKGFSLVGGGHTVAAVGELKLADKMSYVSTAGGALIEFLMGEKLPGVAALEKAARK